jgi:signal transduction histidine kinase
VWGLWLGVATVVASTLAFYYFNVPPLFSFRVVELWSVTPVPVFFFVGLLASSIAALVRSLGVQAVERRREADVAAELAHLLLRSGDLRSALPTASHLLAQALEVPDLAVELEEPVGAEERRRAVPLEDDGTRLGTLLLPPDMPEAVRRRLCDRLVPSLVALLRAAHNRESIEVALAASRDQLAASRARVVAAADETRRRIERDLHDGAQQRLVSLRLELRTAEATVPPELAQLRGRLSHTVQGLTGVLEDLQELSRGIHPAILSKGGLVPALKTLGRRSTVPVELDLHSDRRLPEQVEVALYYTVSEALTNVAKHANASVVCVALRVGETAVHLWVHDDGIGGADPGRGSGLIGLSDRVETLGGTLTITSFPEAGTSLWVTIPIEQA